VSRAAWIWVLFVVIVVLAVLFVAATDPRARANLDIAAGGVLLILVVWLLLWWLFVRGR
jgi:hypothetical protein